MVNYNINKAKKETLNYLRYPVPRTPVSIVRKLKEEVPDFYPNTNPYRVVNRIREKVLKDLLEKNLIVKYTEEDEIWDSARELLKKEYEKERKRKPRNLKELYQINFFYLSEESQFYNLPVLKDVNLNLTAMFYRFLEEKEIKNFFWKILNLFYCYNNEKNKGKIRVKIHSKGFNEKESKLLERALEYSDEVEPILEDFPFDSNIDEAVKFIKTLSK